MVFDGLREKSLRARGIAQWSSICKRNENQMFAFTFINWYTRKKSSCRNLAYFLDLRWKFGSHPFPWQKQKHGCVTQFISVLSNFTIFTRSSNTKKKTNWLQKWTELTKKKTRFLPSDNLKEMIFRKVCDEIVKILLSFSFAVGTQLNMWWFHHIFRTSWQ